MINSQAVIWDHSGPLAGKESSSLRGDRERFRDTTAADILDGHRDGVGPMPAVFMGADRGKAAARGVSPGDGCRGGAITPIDAGGVIGDRPVGVGVGEGRCQGDRITFDDSRGRACRYR